MQNNVEPFVIWFTGLPSAGKSTLADLLFQHLITKKLKVERLDGDMVRQVLPQTGFSKEARNEHIIRMGFLCSILERNGIIVIASFVSPYIEARDRARELCQNFIEVFVDTPLDECERRDCKGLYRQARLGVIKNFTGIDAPYEPPLKPEIVIRTIEQSPSQSLEQITSCLRQKKLISS